MSKKSLIGKLDNYSLFEKTEQKIDIG